MWRKRQEDRETLSYDGGRLISVLDSFGLEIKKFKELQNIGKKTKSGSAMRVNYYSPGFNGGKHPELGERWEIEYSYTKNDHPIDGVIIIPKDSDCLYWNGGRGERLMTIDTDGQKFQEEIVPDIKEYVLK